MMLRGRRGRALSFLIGALTGVAGTRLLGSPSSQRSMPDAFGPQVGRGGVQSPASAASLDSGFEEQDANAHELGWIMAIFAAGAVCAVVLMVVLVSTLHNRDTTRDAGLTKLQRHQSEPPLPHLQADPVGELGTLKIAELRKVDEYVKLDAVTARIPIGRAMELVRGQSLDAHAVPESGR